jgi:cation transport protein ChaC
MAFRIPQAQGEQALRQLWPREMVTGVYDPKWLRCQTSAGPVRALAFTLPRQSPNYTGELPAARYQQIFAQSSGRYGSTLDYARQTHEHLLRLGIRDAALARLLQLAEG